MGVSTEVVLVFGKEKHARWARHVVEGLVKAYWLMQDQLDADLPAPDSLTSLWLAHEEELKAWDLLAERPTCALAWLTRRRTRVVLERCADVQQGFRLEPTWWDNEFFPQLCLAYATRFPQVPFAAYCWYEQTTSGYVQQTRASWNGERLRVRRLSAERPFKRDAWDSWDMLDLRVRDGRLVAEDDAVSPLERHYRALLAEAQEARAAGDAKGALTLADAAAALPGCAGRPEAVELRGLAGRHLARCGVRRILEVGGKPSAELAGRLEGAPVAHAEKEVPLGEGRYVLQVFDRGFRVVGGADGEVAAEHRQAFFGFPDEVRVLDDFRVFVPDVALGHRQFLIDWDFVTWEHSV